MADIVVKGEGEGENITAPVVDLAKDVGEAAAHITHHTEELAAHTLVLGEHETKWKNLDEQLTSLQQRTYDLPGEIRTEVMSILETSKQEILAAVKESTSTPESTESGNTEPPPQKKNEAEKPSFLAGVRRALHRLL